MIEVILFLEWKSYHCMKEKVYGQTHQLIWKLREELCLLWRLVLQSILFLWHLKIYNSRFEATNFLKFLKNYENIDAVRKLIRRDGQSRFMIINDFLLILKLERLMYRIVYHSRTKSYWSFKAMIFMKFYFGVQKNSLVNNK